MVEQAVRLVKHQGAHIIQVHRVVVHQIEQAPGRGHHDVRAAAQAQHLRVDGHAAKDNADLGRRHQATGQALEHITHLHREFAGGHQHQGLHAPGAAAGSARGHHQLQERQGKGRRFARARLGPHQQVAALQHSGNRTLLHWRGRHKTGRMRCGA